MMDNIKVNHVVVLETQEKVKSESSIRLPQVLYYISQGSDLGGTHLIIIIIIQQTLENKMKLTHTH